MWFAAHPLDALAPAGARAGTTAAAAVEAARGRRIAVCGLPCAARRVEAKRGGKVMFTTLADTTGLVECVLFQGAYATHAAAMRAEIVRAEGRVDDTLGALTLVVERAEGFGAGEAAWGAWGEAGPGSRYDGGAGFGPVEPHPGSRNRPPAA
jgi:DNA polymerase III alpha subunit